MTVLAGVDPHHVACPAESHVTISLDFRELAGAPRS